MMQSDAKRRRLRAKTTVGELALAVAVLGVAARASLDFVWRKAFPITRPQNKEYSGHILYEGTAPVFITCKEKWLGPILKDARIALENGEVSQSTMLARRLVVFHFTEKLPVPKGLQIPDCGKCFSQMCQHYAALGQQGK